MTLDTALYGLDIETDTSVDGLDPGVAAIVAVAVATETATSVFCGDEASLLRELAAHVAQLPAGVITTWNGTAFDLPFLAERAERLGIDIGLRGTSWFEHRHLDGYLIDQKSVV